jgi:hypothetical protein
MDNCTNCRCDVDEVFEINCEPPERLCKYCYATYNLRTAEKDAMSIMFNMLERDLMRAIKEQKNG